LVVKAKVNPANVTFPIIAWTSSDTKVATVNAGHVKPLKEGEVTITAAAKDGSGVSASITIKVTPKVMAPGEQVDNLSELSNEQVYTLRSERAFLFYSEVASVTNGICSSTGNSVGAVNYSLTDPNLQFRIEKRDGKYYLYSVGAGKYVNSNGNYVSTPSAELTIENVGGSYPWKMLVGGRGLNSQDPGQNSYGIVVNGWTTTDAGNCYQITEADGSGLSVQEMEDVKAESGDIYDLHGRKVKSPGKGIYIKNRKKIVL
jgi:hypothetical protein